MKKFKRSPSKAKVSSTPSRRKFLAGLGVAAAAVALSPSLKSANTLTGRKSKTGLLATAKRRTKKDLSELVKIFKPAQTFTRPVGTGRLPLTLRPV